MTHTGAFDLDTRTSWCGCLCVSVCARARVHTLSKRGMDTIFYLLLCCVRCWMLK